jgi:hypothetical protein
MDSAGHLTVWFPKLAAKLGPEAFAELVDLLQKRLEQPLKKAVEAAHQEARRK